jgi:hypothetical protein
LAVLSAAELEVVRLALRAMTPDTAALFKPTKEGVNAVFDLLAQALELPDSLQVGAPQSPQHWVLQYVLSPALVETFSSGQMTALLSRLCSLLRRHGDLEPLIGHVLRTLPIVAPIFVQELSNCLTTDGPATAIEVGVAAKKARRQTGTPAVSPAVMSARVQQTAALLEVLLTKPSDTIGQLDRLLAPLFELLGTCMALEPAVQAQAEHVKLLTLECLGNICASVKVKFLQVWARRFEGRWDVFWM